MDSIRDFWDCGLMISIKESQTSVIVKTILMREQIRPIETKDIMLCLQGKLLPEWLSDTISLCWIKARFTIYAWSLPDQSHFLHHFWPSVTNIFWLFFFSRWHQDEPSLLWERETRQQSLLRATMRSSKMSKPLLTLMVSIGAFFL